MGKRARRRSKEQHAVDMSSRRALTAQRSRFQSAGDDTVSLDELRGLVVTRSLVNERIEVVVRGLVASGTGWVPIAAALGVSRQAARQRYASGPPSGG